MATAAKDRLVDMRPDADEVVIDAGPLKVTADQQRTVPIPRIAGVIAIAVGAGMTFFGRQARG